MSLEILIGLLMALLAIAVILWVIGSPEKKIFVVRHIMGNGLYYDAFYYHSQPKALARARYLREYRGWELRLLGIRDITIVEQIVH